MLSFSERTDNGTTLGREIYQVKERIRGINYRAGIHKDSTKTFML